jgi:hypothetical protein
MKHRVGTIKIADGPGWHARTRAQCGITGEKFEIVVRGKNEVDALRELARGLVSFIEERQH